MCCMYIYISIFCRDSKMKGGMVGMTLNKGSVQRWLMGIAERSAISKHCEAMANVTEATR